MKTNKFTLLIIFSVITALIFSCKKNDEPAPSTNQTQPTPTPAEFITFNTTIAVVDFTAPVTPSMLGYSVNVSPTTTAIAYVIANNVKIDSLNLGITRLNDFAPASPSITICDSPYWESFVQNTKALKIKNIANGNSLKIYQNGAWITTVPIYIDVPNAYATFDINAIVTTTTGPYINVYPCQDLKRLRVLQ